jgi:receptor protein-tyrosine kinase
MVPPNPAALLESDAMADLLRVLEDLYDLVILDTPPITVVSDPIPLLSRVRGVLIVSRLRHSTRNQVRALKEQLDALGAPVVGVIVNGAPSGELDGYGYGYGYNAKPDDDITTAIGTAQET